MEVRGFSGPDGDDLAADSLSAVRALPGVRWAEANRTLSRLVVAFDESVISAGQVIAELDRVEHVVSAGHPGRAESAPRAGAPALPGDTAAGTGRMVALGADLVGLAAAATGRVLRLPRLPGAVAAAVTFIDKCSTNRPVAVTSSPFTTTPV